MYVGMYQYHQGPKFFVVGIGTLQNSCSNVLVSLFEIGITLIPGKILIMSQTAEQ